MIRRGAITALILGLLATVLLTGTPAGAQEEGYLGLRITTLTAADRDRLAFRRFQGVRVIEPIPGSPADVAGLRTDDILLTYDGAVVSGFSQMIELAKSTPPGKTVPVTVWRGGAETTLSLIAGHRPDPAKGPHEVWTVDGYGLTLAEATAAVRAGLSIESEVPGLAVIAVADGSAAENAGFVKGDLVTAVNRAPVATPDTFAAAWDAARGAERSTIIVHLLRADGTYALVLPTRLPGE